MHYVFLSSCLGMKDLFLTRLLTKFTIRINPHEIKAKWHFQRGIGSIPLKQNQNLISKEV